MFTLGHCLIVSDRIEIARGSLLCPSQGGPASRANITCSLLAWKLSLRKVAGAWVLCSDACHICMHAAAPGLHCKAPISKDRKRNDIIFKTFVTDGVCKS